MEFEALVCLVLVFPSITLYFFLVSLSMYRYAHLYLVTLYAYALPRQKTPRSLIQCSNIRIRGLSTNLAFGLQSRQLHVR